MLTPGRCELQWRQAHNDGSQERSQQVAAEQHDWTRIVTSSGLFVLWLAVLGETRNSTLSCKSV